MIHRNGCRIVQRVLEHCEKANDENGVRVRRVHTKEIVKTVMENVDELMGHPYGTHVVQSLSETGTDSEKLWIMHKVIDMGIPELSKKCIESNVVEKAYSGGNGLCKTTFVQELVRYRGQVLDISRHWYGSKTIICILEDLPALD